MINPVRYATAILASFFALSTAFARPLPAGFSTFPPGMHTNVLLQAKTGDTVLLIEGRFVSKFEGGILQDMRFRLNNTVLDGTRNLYPCVAYMPMLPKPWWGPMPAYSASSKCFGFQADNDFISGNGPFAGDESYTRVAGYSPILELKVGDLLHPGANDLELTNASNLTFETRRLEFLSAPENPPQTPLFPSPNWMLFSVMPEMIPEYEKLLTTGDLSASEKAQITAALATARYVSNDDRVECVQEWSKALALSDDFPMATEAACRIAGERLRTGQWPDAATEKEVRQAARWQLAPAHKSNPTVLERNSQAWAQLDQALLDVIDGKTESSARPVIHLPFSDSPIPIDGHLDAKIWKSIPAYPVTYRLPGSKGPFYPTLVRFVAQADGIVIGASGTMPAHRKWTVGLVHDGHVWEDNAIEFLVCPIPDLRTYYEFDWSLLGAQLGSKNGWWWRCNSAWDARWQVRTWIDNHNGFTSETFIPWTDLDLKGRPASGSVFVATLARSVVENGTAGSTQTFFTLTPHREFDNHRLMDGFLLVMP